MTHPDVRKTLESFVEARRHWKLHEKHGLFAGRIFEYSSGAYVGLSLRPVHFGADGTPCLWQAQVDEAFSARTTVQTEARRSADCEPWINEQERALEVPLILADCRSYQQADAVIRELASGPLALLAHILDVGGDMQTSAVTRHKLICKCCPAVRKEERSR